MNKIRLGVILPYVKVPAWVAHMLETIKGSSYAEVAAVAFSDPTGAGENPADKLYTLHFQNDLRLFHPEPDPWERRDVRQILQNTQLLGESLEERITRLKALRSDLLLNLSLEKLPTALLDTARFGVWSLRCNNRRVTTSSQFGWLEILQNEPLLHCEVDAQRSTTMQVIAESVVAAHPNSFTSNQSLFLWRMSEVLPRTLKQLHRLGEKDFFARAKQASPPEHYPNPNTVQLLELARKQVVGKLAGGSQKQHGLLMLGIHPEGNKLDWKALIPQEPPRDISWSDPFILKKQDASYVFFEEYSQTKKTSHISCALVENDGNISEPLVVLECPYSLSYPFIFEYRGEFYMTAASQNSALDVYRCKRFPDQWEHHKTILRDTNITNPTLIEHSMRWWMFAGVGDELHLFYTDDPLSENWTPHPMNPVASDVRSAHPAGRIFRRDGGLIRPARDASPRLGRALSFYRITRLTTNEYEEEFLQLIEPPDNVLAVNTYNKSEDLLVTDILLKK